MNEARYRELREKMAALKSLYASRHYSQCAKFGELLLSEIHDQTHPLHLAHLNFYTALSHDTLAREATLKNRWKELSLAELHYNTAILALATLQSATPCDPWSPNSSTSALPSPYSRRRSSIYSNHSAASSATSLGDDDYLEMSPKHSRHASATHAAPPDSLPRASTRTGTTITTTTTTTTITTAAPTDLDQPPNPRPQTPQQFYFNANIASFTRMLDSHLRDVRAQKLRTGVPTVRFCMPSPRTSPTKSPRLSRGFAANADDAGEEEARQKVREMRRKIVFRPRFDPEGVRRLCGEALAELEG
ncbi:hypothetical protein SVAN01_05288 [Stagonosporopsis vannaccii]|nr:hypothetical protein SVAN01_05288 [Stagonosporopsis vannaccii]